MKHAGTESEGTGGFLFCNANANALPLILVKLNSNCAAVSLCLLLQWSGSKTREKIKRKTLPSFTKKKEGRLYHIAAKNPWWLGIFSMTADKLQHNSSRTHQVSEKKTGIRASDLNLQLVPSSQLLQLEESSSPNWNFRSFMFRIWRYLTL